MWTVLNFSPKCKTRPIYDQVHQLVIQIHVHKNNFPAANVPHVLHFNWNLELIRN